MNTDENKTAWKLATQLGRIANQLDLWADECLFNGWGVHQVKPMRDLACEIRAELHGFVPSEKALQDVITLARAFVSEVLHRCALRSDRPVPMRDYPAAQRLKSAIQELEKELTNSTPSN